MANEEDKNQEVKKEDVNKRNKIKRAILWIASIFQFKFYMGYCLGIQLDILIGAFLGLKFAKFDTFSGFFNFFISFGIVIFYSGITFLVVKMIWNMNKKQTEESPKKIEEDIKNKSKWDFLNEDIKKDLKFASLIIALISIKDLILAPVMVFCVISPVAQIVPMLLFTLIIGVFIVARRPFESCFENFAVASTNIFYSILLILYIVLHKSTHLSSKDRQNKIGMTCVILIVAIVAVNLFLALYKLVILIVEMVKKARAKSKVRSRVSPVDNVDSEVGLNNHQTELNGFEVLQEDGFCMQEFETMLMSGKKEELPQEGSQKKISKGIEFDKLAKESSINDFNLNKNNVLVTENTRNVMLRKK